LFVAMPGRVPQPPVNAALRDPERHEFLPGLVLVIIAAALLVVGAGHVTSVETTDGSGARELQLVKAFSCGGLEAKSSVFVPDPAAFDDPAAAAAALERMAREETTAFPIKYRVNTVAAAPCPT
jgi:hypothetical protein